MWSIKFPQQISVCVYHSCHEKNMEQCLENKLNKFSWLLPLVLIKQIERCASVREAVPVNGVVGVMKLVPII